MLLFRRIKTANARTDKNTNFVAIDFFQINSAIFQSLPGGKYSKLGKTIRPANFFRCWKRRRWIKVFYFCRNLTIESRRIKMRNAIDAALACDDIFPKGFEVITKRPNKSKTSD